MLVCQYGFTASKAMFIVVLLVMTAIAMGIIGAMQAGVSYLAFLPNIVGVVIGVSVFALMVRYQDSVQRNTLTISIITLFCLVSVFLFDGIDGVHRWITIGPLLVNVASIALPLIIYNFYVLEAISPYKAYVPVLLALFIFVFQPDAGISFSLFVSTLPFLYSKTTRTQVIAYRVVIVVLSILVWLQHDPLLPVMHVENIFDLMPFGALFIILSMLFVLLPIMCFGNTSNKLTVSMLMYYIGSFIATLFGHFPVHVIGAGLSPVVGLFLAVSLIYIANNRAEIRSDSN